jgi:O-antigen ligase
MFCIIASFPLIPDLHIQLQYIRTPSVKYFIAHPGIDLISGYLVALLAERFSISRRINLSVPTIPWPLSLALVVTTVSAGLSIARSLSQSNKSFSFVDLVTYSLQFKLMDRFNDYYPVADTVVHAFGFLLIVLLLPLLKNSTNRDELVFRPICVGLVISAVWGLFQALTSFGLPITTSQYRIDSFGFGAHGFQPDLHAFAAHMLLGAVGLYGYIGTTKTSLLGKSLLSLLCICCWLALVLSKSRASLLFAIFYTILLVVAFFVKHRRGVKPTAFVVICIGAAAILSFTFFQARHWLEELYIALFQSGDRSFDFLNQVSKFRLEFYAAAVRMWSEFPLFGLGQGSFFKMSAIQDFSGSPLMASSRGENAHNYFLQALAEVGLVGFACYAAVFIWPFTARSDKKSSMLPVGIALGAMFLGNMYSHSFLIRENLYLLAVLIALLYAHHSGEERGKATGSARFSAISITLVIFLVSVCGVQEIVDSFHKVPFAP